MNSKGTPHNLRPAWRKGDPSPNPSGRSLRLPISDIYARIAAEPVPASIRKFMKRDGLDLEPGATFAEALGLRVWARALAGDAGAAKEIREAIEGRTGPRVAPTGEPINIRVVYDDEIPKATVQEESDPTKKLK